MSRFAFPDLRRALRDGERFAEDTIRVKEIGVLVLPTGRVVACRGESEGLALHRADLRAAVLQSRTEAFYGMTLLQDRRPELYQAATDQSYRNANRP